MGILSFLYIPFGYVLKLCCIISGNHYVIALFFFALIMQIVLFPLGIKQQKSSVSMAKMRPKEQIIREKYKGRNDRPTQLKMQEEIRDLYQKEGVSQFSGCLPLLIQLPIILALFGVIRYPLTYSVALSNDSFDVDKQYTTAVTMLEEAKTAIADSEYYKTEYTDTQTELKAKHDQLHETYASFTKLQKGFGAVMTENTELWDKAKGVSGAKDAYGELYLVSFMVRDSAKYEELLAEDYGIENAMTTVFGEDILSQLPSFEFIGDYTFLDTPKDKLNGGFSAIVIMLIMPVLVFLSSFFSGVLTRKFTGAPAASPDGAPVPGNGALMKWGMPALSAYFAFTFPLAIGAYWVYRSILATVQQYALSKMYPIPQVTEEELEEARRMYKGKKKKTITIEVDEDDTSYDNLKVDGGKSDAPSAEKKIVMLTGDEPSDEPKVKAPAKIEKAALKEDKPPKDGGSDNKE